MCLSKPCQLCHSYHIVFFVLVVTSWLRPIVTLRTMGRIVDGVNHLPSSLVSHLILHSHRMRGPREEDCP